MSDLDKGARQIQSSANRRKTNKKVSTEKTNKHHNKTKASTRAHWDGNVPLKVSPGSEETRRMRGYDE